MKLSLTIDKQAALLNSFMALDGYQRPDGSREAYKLGADRRVLVKNISAIQSSLDSYQESVMALRKEIFPGVPDTETVKSEDHPEDFPRFVGEDQKLRAAVDDIDLLQMPSSVAYGENDFPAAAIALIERLGLISD